MTNYEQSVTRLTIIGGVPTPSDAGGYVFYTQHKTALGMATLDVEYYKKLYQESLTKIKELETELREHKSGLKQLSEGIVRTEERHQQKVEGLHKQIEDLSLPTYPVAVFPRRTGA